MKTVEERIRMAENKLKQLKVAAQKIEARKRATLAKQARAVDTRKKILIGALMLDLMEKSAEEKSRFMNKLEAYLTRDDDRALFGWSAVQKTAE